MSLPSADVAVCDDSAPERLQASAVEFLALARDARDKHEACLAGYVRMARTHGVTWRRICQVLRMSEPGVRALIARHPEAA